MKGRSKPQCGLTGLRGWRIQILRGHHKVSGVRGAPAEEDKPWFDITENENENAGVGWDIRADFVRDRSALLGARRSPEFFVEVAAETEVL